MESMTVKLAGVGILKKAWVLKEGRAWGRAEELQFDSQGVASISVDEDVEYSLSWTLIGTPGASWKLEIPSPPLYQWKYYGSAKWYSTRILIEKSLVKTGYTDLRVIKAQKA